jgi:hypothetical protein
VIVLDARRAVDELAHEIADRARAALAALDRPR